MVKYLRMRKTNVPMLLSCGVLQTANCDRFPHPVDNYKTFRLEVLKVT